MGVMLDMLPTHFKKIEEEFNEKETHDLKLSRGSDSFDSINCRIKEVVQTERYYTPSYSFMLSRFPFNCNIVIMYGLSGTDERVRYKFKALEYIIPYLGHSGILLSQSGRTKDVYEVYEEFGFLPILEDFGIQHGGAHRTRLYYKPINEKIKRSRGGEEWVNIVGVANKEDFR